MSTPILEILELTEAQGGKTISINTAFRRIEGLMLRVLSRTNGGPPVAVEGASYIVDVASGDWSTATVGDLALVIGGGWVFLTPSTSHNIWCHDELTYIYYDGAAWQTLDFGIATGKYLEIIVPAEQLIIDPLSAPTLNYFVGNVPGLAFGDAGLTALSGFLTLPGSRKLGTDILMYPHFTPTAAVGDLKWFLEFQGRTKLQSWSAAASLSNIETLASSAYQVGTQFNLGNIANEIDGGIAYTFYREGTDVQDTLVGDAILHSLKFLIEVDQIGRNSLTAK